MGRHQYASPPEPPGESRTSSSHRTMPPGHAPDQCLTVTESCWIVAAYLRGRTGVTRRCADRLRLARPIRSGPGVLRRVAAARPPAGRTTQRVRHPPHGPRGRTPCGSGHPQPARGRASDHPEPSVLRATGREPPRGGPPGLGRHRAADACVRMRRQATTDRSLSARQFPIMTRHHLEQRQRRPGRGACQKCTESSMLRARTITRPILPTRRDHQTDQPALSPPRLGLRASANRAILTAGDGRVAHRSSGPHASVATLLS